MNWVVVLRILHVLLAAFWAGSMFFFVLFLEPSVRSLGPDGGRVIRALTERRFLQVLIGAGTLTIVLGIIVLWRFTNNFSAPVMSSRYGVSLTLGATAGILALGIGVFVSRPTLGRLLALGAEIAARGGPPSEADQAEMVRLQGRLRFAARSAAVLLLIAILFMTAARYA